MVREGEIRQRVLHRAGVERRRRPFTPPNRDAGPPLGDPSNLGFLDRAKYETLQALGYDQIPTRALNYIWASQVEKGTVLDNPFTDWVQMIAVESGSTKVGEWVLERRNVQADYRKAFGETPPPINGIAIMVDTDNTGESATAYFGDIVAEPQTEIEVERSPSGLTNWFARLMPYRAPTA